MMALARWLLRHELRTLQLEVVNARLEAENALLQLTVLRAMHATTMRERDSLSAAFDRVAYDLAKLKQKMRRERAALRTWIERTVAPPVSRN